MEESNDSKMLLPITPRATVRKSIIDPTIVDAGTI